MAVTNDPNSMSKDVLDLIRSLPSVYFAGTMLPGLGALAADCSCQNCGCDSRAGDTCGCNPRCSCQGHTASQLDWAINVMLGAAAHVPLDEVKKLVEFRDKVRAGMRKERPK